MREHFQFSMKKSFSPHPPAVLVMNPALCCTKGACLKEIWASKNSVRFFEIDSNQIWKKPATAVARPTYTFPLFPTACIQTWNWSPRKRKEGWCGADKKIVGFRLHFSFFSALGEGRGGGGGGKVPFGELVPKRFLLFYFILGGNHGARTSAAIALIESASQLEAPFSSFESHRTKCLDFFSKKLFFSGKDQRWRWWWPLERGGKQTKKKVSCPVRSRRKRGRNAKSTVFGGAYTSFFFLFFYYFYISGEPTDVQCRI